MPQRHPLVLCGWLGYDRERFGGSAPLGATMSPLSLPARPKRLFWSLSLLRLSLWTIIPSLLATSAPLDVIEGLAWGRQLQWG